MRSALGLSCDLNHWYAHSMTSWLCAPCVPGLEAMRYPVCTLFVNFTTRKAQRAGPDEVAARAAQLLLYSMHM